MVKNYLQYFSIDFDKTFIAIVKSIAFKVLFLITVYYNLDIDLINIKTAFFYDFINQLIYIKLLKNMETEVNKNIVCKLLKALCGFKQSPCL